MLKLNDLIARAKVRGASDIHMVCGLPFKCRVDGRIENLTDEPLTREDCEEYAQKLNKYGLFSSYSDAAEFCRMWNSLIQTDESPWAVEVSPRPFRVWHYTSRDGETPVFFP